MTEGVLVNEMRAVPKLGIKTQELVDAINALCEEAFKLMKKGEEFGCVNWGDLGVVSVEYRYQVYPGYEDYQPYCVVLVEEADSHKLATWLTNALNGKFPRTIVETEW